MARERERIAMERDRIADERDRAADLREQEAAVRESRSARSGTRESEPMADDARTDQHDLTVQLAANAATRERERSRAARAVSGADADAGPVDATVVDTDAAEWFAARRDFVAGDRQETADERDALADERERLLDLREATESSGDESRHAPSTVAARDERTTRATEREMAALARDVADHDRLAGESEAGRSNPLAAELVSIGRSLMRAETPEAAMTDVVNAAVRFVNGCSAASFSALVGDVVATLASTDPTAVELDEAQYKTAEGPCLEAIQTLHVVISEDLARDDRWPDFVRVAGATGSVLSTPVADDREPRSRPLGSLNGYAAQAQAFGPDDVDTMLLLTAHLGVLLCLAREARESTERVLQMAEAVQTRDVIGQAKGILMERGQLTAGQAFDVLREASQRLNRKLRDVADDLAQYGTIPR